MTRTASIPSAELSYKLMPESDTYALGLHALQQACQSDPSTVHPQFTLDDGSHVYRPLTFKENIEARVKDYETLHAPSGRKRTLNERLRLFNQWQNSCTGIASRAQSTEFKIIPICTELITIPENFAEDYLSTLYTQFAGVKIELDSAWEKYNKPLTQTDALDLEGWQIALEKDTSLLRTFSQIVFTELKRVYQSDVGMSFHVNQDTEKDGLRALSAFDLGADSDACVVSLSGKFGSFLRRSSASSRAGSAHHTAGRRISP